jgi:hypothetical protein
MIKHVGKYTSVPRLKGVPVFQVNPQFYAFRWITLLLTQEFKFHDCLHLWDALLGDPEGPQVREPASPVTSARCISKHGRLNYYSLALDTGYLVTGLLRNADPRPEAALGR